MMTSKLKFNPLSTQHKEWVSLFRQSSVSSSIQSLAFVKKLTAIALSTITYNRGVFATDQYDNYTLDGRPIKLLRGNHESKRAFLFTTCIKSAFQAIEKHYMRELTLEISSTEGSIIEFYKLFYSYEGDKGCISLSQETSRANRVCRLEDIQENTAKMLRCLTRFTQNLKPLPESYIIQLRITYYDEVTPHTYQPTFFSAGNPKELDINLKKDSLGDIKTKYHAVDLESGSLLKYDPTVQLKTTTAIKSKSKKTLPEIVPIQDTDEDSVITSPSTFTIEPMSFGRFTVVSRSKTDLVMLPNSNKPSTSKASDPNIYSLECSEPTPSHNKMIKQTPKKKGILSKNLKEATKDTDLNDVYSLDESPEHPTHLKTPKRKGILSKNVKEATKDTGLTDTRVPLLKENRDIYSLDESPEHPTLLKGNKKGKSAIYCKSKEEVKKSNLIPHMIENIETPKRKGILSKHLKEATKDTDLTDTRFPLSKENRDIYSLDEPPAHPTLLKINEKRDSSKEIKEDNNENHSSLDSPTNINQKIEQINILSSPSPELKEQHNSELHENAAFSQNQNDRVNNIEQVTLVVNESCDSETMQNDPLLGEKQCLQVDAGTNLLYQQSYRDIRSPISSPALDMTNDPAAADEDYDSSESEGNVDMDLTPITTIHHIPEDKLIQHNEAPSLSDQHIPEEKLIQHNEAPSPSDQHIPEDKLIQHNEAPSPNDHQILDTLIPPQFIKKEKEDSWESQEPTTEGYGTSGAISVKERYSFSDPVGISSYDLNLDYIQQQLTQSRETQCKKEDEQIEPQSAGDINNNEKYISVQNQDNSDEEMGRIKRLKLEHSQGSPSYSSFIHTTKETSEETDINIKMNCICLKDCSNDVFKCQSCNAYHHVVCYGFLPGETAPLIGCCYQCASEANIPQLCSDNVLMELEGNPILLAIYRQIIINLSLHCKGGKHHISIETMKSWMGSEIRIADEYIQRLNDEGFIRPSSRRHNEFTVKVKKLEMAIKENFRCF